MVGRHTLARWRFENSTSDWRDDAVKYEVYHWSNDKETQTYVNGGGSNTASWHGEA